ncbi:hypothetical protein [Sorangium sp. So ce1024]|uniref:hypothetical protein n=1 Tax=Sorangium sp. So ce1024 TaxID=3133327 RepID=UPI003F0F6328
MEPRIELTRLEQHALALEVSKPDLLLPSEPMLGGEDYVVRNQDIALEQNTRPDEPADGAPRPSRQRPSSEPAALLVRAGSAPRPSRQRPSSEPAAHRVEGADRVEGGRIGSEGPRPEPIP